MMPTPTDYPTDSQAPVQARAQSRTQAGETWLRQNLAYGTPGGVLLRAERAYAGTGSWQDVHVVVRAMLAAPVESYPPQVGLWQGVPAIAYVLHAARFPGYQQVFEKAHLATVSVIEERLATSTARAESGRPGPASEYDLMNGLTGLGVYLLYVPHFEREAEVLRALLGYLVNMVCPGSRARPVTVCGERVPGWWSTGSPDVRASHRWRWGHAGFGIAHGISGPLALLSASKIRGITVPGQDDAIEGICEWLDRWRQDSPQGAWWPDVIDLTQLQSPASQVQPTSPRPSWCYGIPGIARALQLAGTAMGQPALIRLAHRALEGALTDPAQLDQITDPGLCHGWAGLKRTAVACAETARELGLHPDADALSAAAGRLPAGPGHGHLLSGPWPTPADWHDVTASGDRQSGLLEGITGSALTDSTQSIRWANALLL